MTNKENFAEILDEYLRALEAGNPPDREALLARHPELEEELKAALLGIDFVHVAAPRLAPDEHAGAQPGRSLGDYRLLRELGRGGMAVVYEAEQVSLARRVALKVLPFAAVLDPKQLQRFKNEALAAAHLRHPNIVPVYGVGCDRGVHFYAMQYVDGQSLAMAIRDMKRGSTGEEPKTPISSHGSNREAAYIRMAAALGVQAAEALDHAHQLGIVHRDVKPGNLLADLAGTLWVTDFGLASSIKDVSLTITGELLGTLRYMSPEQALAKRAPVDHRTDVYSLGATLYELLTLEPAFPGDDVHRVMQDIALEEPVLPRRLNPALPRDLETVVLKAMSKDPGSRYATAQEMADDLERFLENLPIEAKRPGLIRRASKWSRRHRTLVAATVVLLLLSTVGLATGTALLWREQKQTKTAYDNAQANLRLALEALDQIYIDEAESHPKIREGLPKDLLEKGLGFYEEFAKENAGNRASVFLMGNARQRAGLIFREMGQEERAVQSLEGAISALDLALVIAPRDTAAHINRGHALHYLGRFDEALTACERALEIDPQGDRAHINRGIALARLGRFEEALAAYDRALEIDWRDAEAHTNRGCALAELKRFEESLAACDQALEIDSLFVGAHASRGSALENLGRFEEALEACELALEIDPRSAAAHCNRGSALRGLQRMDESLAACDRAVDIDPRSAPAHNNRCLALRALGRFEDALAACNRSIELDPRDSQQFQNLGVVLSDLGRVADALAAYDQAVEIDPRSPGAHTNRGALLVGSLGRPEEALAEFDYAIELDPLYADAHHNRSHALHGLGRMEEALAEFDHTIELGLRVVRAHDGRANLLCDLGRFEEALAACDLALAIDPMYAGVHLSRGMVLCDHLSRPDEALAEFDLEIELDARSVRAHTSRAVVLCDLRRFEEALAACDQALTIDPQFVKAYACRGNALSQLGRFEEALAGFDHAIELAPEYAEAHNCRGTALRSLQRLDEALAEFDRAIELDRREYRAHYNQGNALLAKGDAEAAIAAFGEAIRLRPDFAEAHCNLGLALMGRGSFQEAVLCLRKGHELGSRRAGWPYPSGEWIEDAERKAAMEGPLAQVPSGQARSQDALERIELALALYDKARHTESARMFAEAFAADAALAEDLAKSHRYNAARSAALAAANEEAGAAEWRGRALEWLRADLAAREKAVTGLAAMLEHWKKDPDFASVRDRLGELPGLERAAWGGFWAAVELALAFAPPATK
jgi:tetratricopeptide (TPR) repeat protein